jgi:signal transduction histidine kinase
MTSHEQRLREAIRVRDSFLLTVARGHEAWVAAAAKSARRVRRTDPVAPALRRAVDRLRDLARELLIIADPGAPIALAPRRMDLVAHVANAVAERAQVLAAHDLQLVMTRPRQCAVVGSWDPAHVASMVLEIVGNAVKYGRGKPVTITLSLAKGSVALHVRNRGTWQGPRTATRFLRGPSALPGYGIGVWLTRRLALAHGGRMRIVSRDGWTTVSVLLPKARAIGDLSAFRISIEPQTSRRQSRRPTGSARAAKS